METETPRPADALLNITLHIAATPTIQLASAAGAARMVLQGTVDGFTAEASLALPYDKLSTVLNGLLRGKRLTLTEGLIRQHIELQGCRIFSNAHRQLVAEVPFSGSFNGVLFIAGHPVYNTATKAIDLQNIAHDIQTKNLLLKGAKWLFGSLIRDELKKHATVDLAPVFAAATAGLSHVLNSTWASGIEPAGAVTLFDITHIEAGADSLLVHLRCNGKLQVTVSETALPF